MVMMFSVRFSACPFYTSHMCRNKLKQKQINSKYNVLSDHGALNHFILMEINNLKGDTKMSTPAL